MCTNLALSADSLIFSEDIHDGEFDKKFCFANCWSIKIFVFMEPRIAEKIIVIFVSIPFTIL